METRLEPTGEIPLLPAAVKAGSSEGKQKAFWGSGSSLGVSLVKTVHIAEGRLRVFYTGAFSVTTLCCTVSSAPWTVLGAAFQACLARALPTSPTPVLLLSAPYTKITVCIHIRLPPGSFH